MTVEKIELRAYAPDDCAEMYRLFYETVHSVNAKDYTEEQLNAWAGIRIDLDVWNRSFLAHCTLVAVGGGHILGFGDIDRTGYLDRLYVHKNYQGRGIGTALCDRLEKAFPVGRVTTQASVTARPFFESRGYQVMKRQEVERGGVKLKNYVMVREPRGTNNGCEPWY